VAEGRGGVVKKFLDHTTPSARTNEASRLFGIARPNPDGPPPAEEGSSQNTLLVFQTSHRTQTESSITIELRLMRSAFVCHTM
jgi:hypothetical protein